MEEAPSNSLRTIVCRSVGELVVWLTLAAIAVTGELIYRFIARARKRR